MNTSTLRRIWSGIVPLTFATSIIRFALTETDSSAQLIMIPLQNFSLILLAAVLVTVAAAKRSKMPSARQEAFTRRGALLPHSHYQN